MCQSQRYGLVLSVLAGQIGVSTSRMGSTVCKYLHTCSDYLTWSQCGLRRAGSVLVMPSPQCPTKVPRYHYTTGLV